MGEVAIDIAEYWRRKKREEEERWKKLFMYYMLEREKMRKEGRLQELDDPFSYGYFAASGRGGVSALGFLLRIQPDGTSLADRVKRIGELEDEDSPFRRLWEKLSEDPASEQEVQQALERVIQDEPPRMLADAQRERERRFEFKRVHREKERLPEDLEAVRYDRRVEDKLSFLRLVMPKELFEELTNSLQREGRFLENDGPKAEKEPEPRPAVSYQQYVESKSIDPKVAIDEKSARLANSGDVYTAAAYVLAAWEQKDAEVFDPQKADARALELSGSRAFRVYMKGHPGSLIAAARNTGVDVTHDNILALESKLEHRDAVLADAKDSLRHMSSGKTKCFHQMLNALERFVNADEEPTQRQKKDLVNAMGEYILTDCAPNSRIRDGACFTQAMRSMKVLLPEQKFSKLVALANEGRDPKVKEEDFDLPVSKKAAAPEKEAQGPVLGLKHR